MVKKEEKKIKVRRKWLRKPQTQVIPNKKAIENKNKCHKLIKENEN